MAFDSAQAERYVRLAIVKAEEAAQSGNQPFGAVIVDTAGRLAIVERNRTAELSDPSAHAEIVAIRTLCRQLGTLELPGHRLYTNAQSCPMCFACMVQVRITDLVFGAPPVPGVWPLPIEEFANRFDHKVHIHGGILRMEAAAQLERVNR